MLEAVGDQYLDTYFAKVRSLLTPDGRFAAQFITCPDARHAELRRGVDWIQKHIFPGSLLLSMNRVGAAVERTRNLWLKTFRTSDWTMPGRSVIGRNASTRVARRFWARVSMTGF